MNTPTQNHTSRICAAIDGVPIANLISEHGSPLFVFSENALRRASREASSAFRRVYPDVQFAWSYKTNYLKAVCTIFHQEDAIAEVVSDFEYEKARGMGLPGHDIIFNGPFKPTAALERAVDEQAKIQIDNWDELLALGAIAEAKKRSIDVAIRVYADCGTRPVWSKFGFNADTDEAREAVRKIGDDPRLRLVGLHTHVGTLILDPTVYTRATEKLIDLSEVVRSQYDNEISYLNLGGGFAPRIGPPQQHLPGEKVTGAFDAYAEAICQPILRRWPKERKLPRLYLETGRALVDEAGYLITTIVAHKHKQAMEPMGYVVDAGVNLLPASALPQFNVFPARFVDGTVAERTVFGCLCMNTDVLHHGEALPHLNVGDFLVFHPVGAYNVTQSMQFITYRPRIVMVTEAGGVQVIRERENLQHVEALERVPQGVQTVS